MVILRQCIIASSAAMVNVSFGFVEKNLQNLLNHTKNAMQKVNCFTLRCFSYIIVDKKQGRSKFFSVRELVLTMSIGNQISAIRNEQQLTQEQFGSYSMLQDRRFRIGKMKRVIRIYRFS